MERARTNMAKRSISSIMPSIRASVTFIGETFLRLSSQSLRNDEFIQISAIVATSALPRPFWAPTPLLTEEFRLDDEFNLDIIRDVDYYIPVQIHEIKLHRSGGTRIVAGGFVIDVSDPIGPVIRSSCIPDFMCPKDRCAIPGTAVAICDSVTFEALITTANIEGLSLRINPPGSKGSPFPVYVTNGVVQKMPSSDEVKLRCMQEDGQPVFIPLYHSAYFGCGVPVYALAGETVRCTICPRQPHLGSPDLQAIFFEPTTEGTVPRLERFPSAALDASRTVGSSAASRKTYHEVQCSRYFNEDTMKLLRSSFLFTMAHSEDDKFDSLIRSHPKLVSIVLNEMGIGDGEIYGDNGGSSNEDSSGTFQGDTPRGEGYEAAAAPTPVAANYLPDNALLHSPIPVFPGGDGDSVQVQDGRGLGGRRVPMPPNFHPSELFGPGLEQNEQLNRAGQRQAHGGQAFHGSGGIVTRDQAIRDQPPGQAVTPASRRVEDFIPTAQRGQVPNTGNNVTRGSAATSFGQERRSLHLGRVKPG